MVWVVGPPGCGKTTLVASYLEARKPDFRWYQLDQADSDAATFFYYMGLSAQGAQSPAQESLPLFTGEYRGDLSGFSRRYFQALYAQLQPPFALVLDNYQDLAAQSSFHDVLLDAATEMPPDGCIIVMSRSEPPASMVRLRANRAVEMLGWNDLQLTLQEMDARHIGGCDDIFELEFDEELDALLGLAGDGSGGPPQQ